MHSLYRAVQHYFTAALCIAQSSYNTYIVAANKYLAFCESFLLSPLLTLESTLRYLKVCFGQQGLTHSTIHTYISEIRHLQIAHKLLEPKIDIMPQLCQVLKGLQIENSK